MLERSSNPWHTRAARAIAAAVLLVTVVMLGAPAAHAAVAWSFDYQGELKSAGLPVSGPTDMAFKLWNTEVGGLQVGPTLTMTGVPVTSGVFTVRLDFTNGGVIPGIFDGNERYLEVIVNGTPLTPRQRLSPAPNAVTAQMLNFPFAARTVAPNAFDLFQDVSTPQSRAMHISSSSVDTGAVAIMGEMLVPTPGNGTGVAGISRAGNGFGVIGANEATSGNCTGVYGSVVSPFGNGVLGIAASPTGPNKGVYGRTLSSQGWGGYFEGRGYFRDAVGIGLDNPGAKLHIGGAVIPSGLALNVEDRFFVGSGSDFVSINRTTPVTSAEFFGVRAPVSGNSYGGMYMETESATGKPFYGYATNGVAQGWTYYDGQAGEWRLSVGTDRIIVPRVSGNVGIKRSPTTNDLEVEGTASKTTAGSWLANSDARIKTDVESVTGALDTLDRVRLVSFRYNDEYRAQHPTVGDRRYLNVIAQEFREVFPEDVKGSGEKLANGDEILQVDTYPLTIYAAAGVQELHAMLKDRDARIAQLEDSVSKLQAMVTALAMDRGTNAQTTVQSAACVPASAGE